MANSDPDDLLTGLAADHAARLHEALFGTGPLTPATELSRELLLAFSDGTPKPRQFDTAKKFRDDGVPLPAAIPDHATIEAMATKTFNYGEEHREDGRYVTGTIRFDADFKWSDDGVEYTAYVGSMQFSYRDTDEHPG